MGFEVQSCKVISLLFLLFQCSAYEAGQVSGPLCSDLCEKNSIHFGKCFSTVVEKMVYDGEWRGTQSILKMNMDWFNLFEERQKLTDNDVVSSYEDDVSARIGSLFADCSQCDKLTSRLLLIGDSNSDAVLTASEVRTFVSLLHLVEPMMLLTLNESKHTVDFYGYCGGLYVVEKLPYVASQVFGEKWELRDLSLLPDLFEPLEEVGRDFAVKIVNTAFSIPYISTILSDTLTITKSLIFRAISQTHVPSQSEKFKFIYSLLDAVLDVSSSPYGMLQACDMHLGNFGFTSNSTVKVIDFDHTFPLAHLRTLLEQKHCTSDDECWVGNSEDCQSSCDTTTGTCTSVVRKHDLINLCEIHFPFIFRSPSMLQLPGQNTTCLTKAMSGLVAFCQQLPFIESIHHLRQGILAVKEKLQIIERNSSEMC